MENNLSPIMSSKVDEICKANEVKFKKEIVTEVAFTLESLLNKIAPYSDQQKESVVTDKQEPKHQSQMDTISTQVRNKILQDKLKMQLEEEKKEKERELKRLKHEQQLK